MPIPAELLALERPLEEDLEIFQGDSRVIPQRLAIKGGAGLNLSDLTFRLQVRANPTDDAVIIAALVEPDPVSAATGWYNETWDRAETAALLPPDGTPDDQVRVRIGWYDCDVSDTTQTVTFRRGNVYLIRQASRA